MTTRFRERVLAAAILLACSLACTGSGGSGGSSSAGFQLVQISVPSGAVWQINRPIEFTFNDEVDFSTVSLNTIGITTVQGAPATGSFTFKPVDLDGDGELESVDRTTVVFQPKCPLEDDLSDAGLLPGSVDYSIVVLGRSSGASNVVRSITGELLQFTQSRAFTTPSTNDPSVAFFDTVTGPPVPVIRQEGSSESAATYVEVGGDDSARVYFELDPNDQTIDTNPPGFAFPLNLFSDAFTGVAVVIEFDQPVSPSSENISSDRLSLEYLDASLQWTAIDTSVRLAANCTSTGGARVRLEPVGVLPAASRFRAVVRAGFQDLVGEGTQLELDRFAEAPTLSPSFSSLTPPDLLGDALIEEFDLGGNQTDSFEDADALFSSTKAAWKDGALTAAFSFVGTGGPNGDFDWIIEDGEVFFFDTTSTTITGGPGGIPSATQTAVGGIVDVRDLIIEEGGLLRVQGPNTMVVNATGSVQIRGTWDVSGFDAKNVATLGTGNQAEKGAAGAAGGGDGGNASEITTNSTKQGGAGFGAFQVPRVGGQGGESGFAPSSAGKDARRPGTGGGGAFGEYPGVTSLEPEDGRNGSAQSTGCLSGVMPAAGGPAGSVPFSNTDLDDNVFGVRPLTDGAGTLLDLVSGELTGVFAGGGGGGGGDALPSSQCPTPNWGPASDEKGGGAGGGAGGLRVNALGPIVLGSSGLLLAVGGRGATGENTSGFDRIGGNGGGGSGGHVVLESAAQIDFTDGSPATAPTRDYLSATGGLGGGGGGSGSRGGKGGAGIVQLHVPDPIARPAADTGADLVVPTAAAMDVDPLSFVSTPTGIPMIQTFGARSEARSKWISIGGADQDPGGGESLVEFLFGGIETTPGADAGKVLTANEVVVKQTPLILVPLAGSSEVTLEPDGVTLRLSGSVLSPLIDDPAAFSSDVYLRAPALLRHFALRLAQIADPENGFRDFEVTAADYDDAAVVLTLTTTGAVGTLQDYVDQQGEDNLQVELIPRFFRIRTGDQQDALPDDAFVRITFDAAAADAFGNPDEANLLVEGTADLGDFNALPPGLLQFFRFQVEFQLDADGNGVSTETNAVAIEFLKLPFRF